MRDKGHLDDREIQSDLYAAYRSSVRDNSGALISQDRFATAIQDRGVTPDPGRARSINSGGEAEIARFCLGIRFRDNNEENPDFFCVSCARCAGQIRKLSLWYSSPMGIFPRKWHIWHNWHMRRVGI